MRAAFTCILLLLGATAFTGGEAAAAHLVEPPPKHPKLALELRREVTEGQTGRDSATRRVPDRLKVQIETRYGDTALVAEGIAAAGGSVLGAIAGSIEADIPVGALEGLAAREDVHYVSQLEHLVKASVSSEGVASTGTTSWQTRGYRGKGVKIGVVDGSFADYPARQASGDLPPSLTAVDLCSGNLLTPADDGAHGTAVAEIMYDMAPEASLYLICIGDGLAPLQSAVNYAKAQGIRVINFSAGYPASSRGDGRGGSGTAEGIVADATAAGIVWVNAAGNEAERHWSGPFAAAPGGQWLQFAPGVDRQTFAFPYGAFVCAYLRWDEWPVATSDYDVFLFGNDPVNPVSGSDRPSVGAQPREAFCYPNLDPSTTTFHLGIWRASGTATPRIDLFVTASRLDHPVASGSVVEPATVSSVITVGAACWQTGLVDSYSSRGPTIDGRIKPDILGPSEVSTATYGGAAGCSRSVGFPGTSSSAPHVAGAAALVLQANPTFTPDQVRSFLMSTATDGGPPGLDSDYGSGLLNLGPVMSPIASGPCPLPRIDQPTALNYLPNVTKALGGPTGFTTPFIVQNSGSVPTDLEIEFKRFSDGACVWRRSVPTLLPGASFAATLVNDALLPPDRQFSVVIRSFGAPIVSVVNEQEGSGVRSEAMSYVGFSEGATTVWLPNVVRRFFGYHTPIVMQNLGSVAASATARFVPFSGGAPTVVSRTVQPGQSQFIEPNVEPGLVDGRQYAVTITSSQPVAVVVNTQNDDPGVANPVAYATNGIASGGFAVYGAYAAKNANDSGRANTTSTIVVQNVSATPIVPAIGFTPLGGGAIRRFTRTGPLAPGAAWVFDPRYANGDTTLQPCAAASAACLADGEYSFVANAAGQIAAVVNVISPASAMGYGASAQTAATYDLPNVTRALGGASGWTTPILLQSVTATSAVLAWRSFRTGLVTRQTVTLTPPAAMRIDPRNVPGLTDDTQYAVTIAGQRGTDPGNVNAIVIEVADGADNAMMYEGFAVGPVVASANVVFTDIIFNGRVPVTEADEYVELQNQGSLPQNMSGWKISSLRGGQTYAFGALTMQPGQICRLYTNEIHPEWCGLSWGRA
ncbi:MAG TPA: S8 family serine peptidase, partial [Candidatus Limnocylindria bacterium]|nr:S8 family serine peptidase [Candidatus Limnocylindria bacterium]